MPNLSEKGKLRLGRSLTAIAGVVAFIVAGSGESIKGLVEIASSFGSSGIVVALLFGLHTKFGDERAAVSALVTGAALSFLATASSPGACHCSWGRGSTTRSTRSGRAMKARSCSPYWVRSSPISPSRTSRTPASDGRGRLGGPENFARITQRLRRGVDRCNRSRRARQRVFREEGGERGRQLCIPTALAKLGQRGACEIVSAGNIARRRRSVLAPDRAVSRADFMVAIIHCVASSSASAAASSRSAMATNLGWVVKRASRTVSRTSPSIAVIAATV